MKHLARQQKKYYINTKYTPQIITKVANEKPSAIGIIESFVTSGNTHGIIVISEKQMAKVLHKSLNTIYSDVKYLVKNEYVAVGSTGGKTNNVFMLNPNIFWFKDAAYTKHHNQNIFPSAVTLGKTRNHKFYKMVQTFSKVAQDNIIKDPIFAKKVKKITKNNGVITLHISQDTKPVERALMNVMFLRLHTKALEVVKYVFSKLAERTSGIYIATNKDICNGLRKQHIKVSLPTVARTMAKLVNKNILIRSNGDSSIAFTPQYYEENKRSNKHIEKVRQHNLIKKRQLKKHIRHKKKAHIKQLELKIIKGRKNIKHLKKSLKNAHTNSNNLNYK